MRRRWGDLSISSFYRVFFSSSSSMIDTSKLIWFDLISQLIKQELSIDGLLDINIPMPSHYSGSHYNPVQNTSMGLPLSQNSDATKRHSVQNSTQSAGVTSPSWVHWVNQHKTNRLEMSNWRNKEWRRKKQKPRKI